MIETCQKGIKSSFECDYGHSSAGKGEIENKHCWKEKG